MDCRWCGNEHAVSELCRARRVSRRMFCFAVGAAAVAAALPAVPEPLWETVWIEVGETSAMRLPPPGIDSYVQEIRRRGPFEVTLNF